MRCGRARRDPENLVQLEDRSPEMLEGIYLNGYWDGEKEPSVCAPIGDFFCMGYGGMKTFENEFFASPEGRSFLCQIPMPFLSVESLH